MKRTVLAVAIAACALMLGVYAYAESKEYRVGCLFDKTGSAAWLGEPQWGTAKMIEKEINDAGGINGHKLVLEMEDSQGENNVAKEKVKKLISKKVCAIVGPSRTGTTMTIIDDMNKAQIPLLSCASAEDITKPVADRKWIFKTAPNDSDAVRKIYDHLKEKGITDIGIITGTSAFGAAGRTQMKNLAKEYGINILADETYNPNDTDMTPQLVKIRNANVKALINWDIVPAQSIVPKNMKQLKIEIPLYQSHGFANIKYAEAAGASAEGTIFPAGRIMAADTLADSNPQKAVLIKYKKAYETAHKDTVSTFGGHAYDSLWLVINALKAVGDDPVKIRDFLEKTEFSGIGGLFKFSAQDHCGLDKNAFELLTVKDGKFVVFGK